MSKPKRTLKRIPVFETQHEEREFWATHDTLLTELKLLANERDVPPAANEAVTGFDCWLQSAAFKCGR